MTPQHPQQEVNKCVDYGNPRPTHHMCLHCGIKEACEEEYQNRIADDAFVDHITGGNYG